MIKREKEDNIQVKDIRRQLGKSSKQEAIKKYKDKKEYKNECNRGTKRGSRKVKVELL